MKPKSVVGNKGLNNMNGHVLCAIDTETTGLHSGFHDVIEIAIIPLDANLDVMDGVLPFHTLLQPKRPQNIEPEAMKINGIELAEVQLHGLDPWRAADLFESWFNGMKLTAGKKIIPLAKNWSFDSAFIKDWLGKSTFDYIFHYHAREVTAVAAYLNDRAEFMNVSPPFPKLNLQYLASQCDINTGRAHRALDDAMTTAKVYSHMVRMFVK